MNNADLSETVDHPNSQTSPSNEPNATSSPHAHCFPGGCLDCFPVWSGRVHRPENFAETVSPEHKLEYKRRNTLKMPAMSTASIPLFLRSLLAWVLFIISLRKSGWYRLDGELIQERVEATLPLLKAAVLSEAGSEHFSAEFMKHEIWYLGTRSRSEYYFDRWSLVESTSLEEHWRHLLHSDVVGWSESFYDPIYPCLMALIFALQYRTGATVFYASFCLVAGFNSMITSTAYARRFRRLDRPYQGFEWVNALSPKPSVGIWWEVELMAMPAVWFLSTFLLYILTFTAIPHEGDPPYPMPKNPVWYVLLGLLFVLGISHAGYVMLTTKRDVEAVEKSWQTRIDGWVFERQYGIPAPLSNKDQELDIEAM